MLRCRKCRKGVIDSTCLTTDEATDEGSAAVCSIWHVNVDSLPQWILTSLEQAQWTAGKLNCLNCGARLGSFNFIRRSKCPCAQDSNVHLNKSRVDCDHKRDIFIPQPRNTRLEMSRAAPPTVDCENGDDDDDDSLSRLSAADASDGLGEMLVVDSTMADRRTDYESTQLPVSHPSTQDTDTQGVSSSVSGGRQLQSAEALELSVESTTVRQQVSNSALFLRRRITTEEGTEPRASTASRSLSRKEKNRLKGQRRKQRRRERWLLSQQQHDSDSGGEEEEEEEEDREDLTCTVCLDVYFRPRSCDPCGHVFCELCLRTLAKNRRTKTVCPLCRTLISHTDLHMELDQAAKTSFPKVYLVCQQNFISTPAAKWPLPSCQKRFGVKRRLTMTQRSHWHLFHGSFMCSFSKFTTLCLLSVGLFIFVYVFVFSVLV